MLLAAVWLYVTDPARSREFYAEALGLSLVGEDRDEHEEPVAHFDAGTVRLSLHPWHTEGPVPAPSTFLVFVVPEIEAEVEKLRARGVEFAEGVQSAPFGQIAQFHDPDGHELYLWQLPDEGTEAYERVRPLAEHYTRLAARLNPSQP